MSGATAFYCLMTDRISREARSRNMAAIRGKDTKPERVVRRLLHRRGYRFRLHDSSLPGKPDIVLPKWHAVIFVHGCFWHGHGCHLFRVPASNTGFWVTKICGNIERDRIVLRKLQENGWRIAVVWECVLKGKTRTDPEDLAQRLSDWIQSDEAVITIGGDTDEKRLFV